MANASTLKLRNFRCIAPLHVSPTETAKNQQKILFRSNNVDNADEFTVAHLTDELKIKTIIDFRALCPAKQPLTAAYKPLTLAEYQREKAAQSQPEAASKQRYHVFLPFINGWYLIELTRRQPVSMYPTVASWYFRYFLLGDESVLKEVGRVTAANGGLIQSYYDFLNTGKHIIRSAVEILAQPENVPAMICCQIGKDRTGVMAALILHILGHSVEEIVDDYNATEAAMVSYRDQLVIEMKKTYGVDESFAAAKKQTMLDLFKWIDENYGSVDNYLTQAGVDEALRARLRTTLGSAHENAPNASTTQRQEQQ